MFLPYTNVSRLNLNVAPLNLNVSPLNLNVSSLNLKVSPLDPMFPAVVFYVRSNKAPLQIERGRARGWG